MRVAGAGAGAVVFILINISTRHCLRHASVPMGATARHFNLSTFAFNSAQAPVQKKRNNIELNKLKKISPSRVSEASLHDNLNQPKKRC